MNRDQFERKLKRYLLARPAQPLHDKSAPRDAGLGRALPARSAQVALLKRSGVPPR